MDEEQIEGSGNIAAGLLGLVMAATTIFIIEVIIPNIPTTVIYSRDVDGNGRQDLVVETGSGDRVIYFQQEDRTYLRLNQLQDAGGRYGSQ